MGLRGWAKRKAKKAKKDFEKAGKVLEDTAKDTGKVFEKAGKDVGKSFEQLAKESEEFFTKEARNVVQKIFNDAKRDIERFAEKATQETRDAFTKDLPKLAEAAFQETRDAFEKELPALAEKAFEETKVAFVEELPSLLEEAALKLAKEASARSIKEALNNAADVIEVMAPTKFTLIFGIELALVVQGEVTVQFSFPDPVAKLTEVRQWAKKPPKGRSQIIACIKDFGPESLSVEFKVSGNGLAAEWDGDDKYDRIDTFLKKHGV